MTYSFRNVQLLHFLIKEITVLPLIIEKFLLHLIINYTLIIKGIMGESKNLLLKVDTYFGTN